MTNIYQFCAYKLPHPKERRSFKVEITKDIKYVGVEDMNIDLFEGQYPVPNGISYNSYIISDKKTAVMDTVDKNYTEEWLKNIASVLSEKKPDYLIIQHMEPDHSANIVEFLKVYPDAVVVGNEKTFEMMDAFFEPEYIKNRLVVKDGDVLSLGSHELTFVFAPMVHWPEVMLTYIPEDGILFSADAFGTFGALPGSIFAEDIDFERDFLDDARRYYFNIVGKYGVQVQNVLKKAAGLAIHLVCPLHGPVWRENFGWFLKKYLTWSAYEPEEKCLAVFYASVYGHTQNAAEIAAAAAAEAGAKVKVFDVSVTSPDELLSEAFRCSHALFAATTYNNGVFVSMENFLSDLKAHNYQNRAFAVVENGSWAPQAGGLMEAALSGCKNMRQLGGKVTVLSAVTEEGAAALRALGKCIAEDMQR